MESNDEDILLAKLVREGDEYAFKHLFYKYAGTLRQFAETLIGDSSDAEDLVVDLFSSVWENRENWKIQLTVRAYLFQAIRNNALTFLRDRKEFLKLDNVKLESDISDGQQFIETNELYLLIEEAVSLLPEKCREIFERSRNEGQSYNEIAADLNLAEKTVENQITIALKKIRSFLGDRYSYLW